MPINYKILGKSGSDSILFAHKSALLLDDNMPDDALNLCEMGVKKFPFYAEGHFVLGRCYQIFERYDDAKNEFERTLFFAPGHVKALSALAYVYYKKKLKKIGNKYLLKTAVYEPNNKELIDYLESQHLYMQLFTAPIVEEQLSADLDGFLPTEEERKDLQERVEKTFSTSDETKRILKKDQVDLAKESYKNQDAMEVKNIIDSLDETELSKSSLDLSQYANVEDDFSTLMGEFTVGKGKSENNSIPKPEEKRQSDSVEPAESTMEEAVAFIDDESPEEAEKKSEDIDIEEQDTKGNEAEVNISADIPVEATPPPDQVNIPVEDVLDVENSKEQENAYSDLLLEKDGGGTQELPAFDSKNLEPVDVLEKEAEKMVEENAAEIAPAFIEDDSPVTEEQIPQEEDVIFAKKKIGSDSVIPEPDADEDKTVTIEEIMSNPSLVTPTFGEILISQRKFSEARHVFLKLWERDPDNPRFKEKVEFLDKLIKLQT